ncbi:hypothetical protein Tco_0532969 [Tanacetum coccineum]
MKNHTHPLWWLGREMKVAVVLQRRLSRGDGDGDDGDKGDGMSDDDDGLVWCALAVRGGRADDGGGQGWPERRRRGRRGGGRLCE